MNKVSISENFIAPNMQTVNKNQQETEFILMDLKTGELFLLHQYYCITSEDYANLIALLQTQAINDTQCPYILNPVGYLPIRFTNPHFQTSHFVQVLYQYGSHTLEQQLYLRMEQKNCFQQHEIWSILGSCVLGLKNLRDKGFNHSSICMNDIFVNAQGQIKLCHPMFRTYDHHSHSLNTNLNYMEKVLQQGYYFAPEHLELGNCDVYYIGEYEQKVRMMNYFKCDIFSLGMVVVALGLLSSVGECYVRQYKGNRTRLVIDTNRLQHYFYILQQSYTQDLLNLLSAMLTFQPQQRISIEELGSIIQQMIQAKRLQEQSMDLKRSQSQLINEDSFHNILGESAMNSGMTNYSFEQNNMPSSIAKKNFQQIPTSRVYGKSQQIIIGAEGQSRSSRINNNSVNRQMSPISGRKIKNKCIQQSSMMSSSGKIIKELMPCDVDTEDKPSAFAIQCLMDVENMDAPQNQQDSQILTQQNIDNPIQQEIFNLSFPNIINQTLTNYIKQQSESSIAEVNRTSTQQEQIKEMNQKKGSQPKEITSVMTSRELCSLPDDELSLTDDNDKINHYHPSKQYTFNKPNNRNTNEKQNQINLNNTTYLYSNSLKHQQILQHPLSARTFNKKKGYNSIKHQNSSIKADNNQEMSISLNKDYQSITASKQNSDNIYTDPKFLQMIRQDVNKILMKRGINNEMKKDQQMCHSNSNNYSNKTIIVNGKKVNQLNTSQYQCPPHQHQQSIYPQLIPYQLHQQKPILYR